MKQLNQMLPTGRNQLAKMSQSYDHQNETSKFITSVIDDLFSDIMTICTAWRKTWHSREILVQTKKSWIEHLVISGINNKALLKRGIEGIKNRGDSTPFIMTSSEFISLCLNDSSEPSPLMAFHEAIEKSVDISIGNKVEFSCERVKQALLKVGVRFMSTRPESDSKKLFIDCYSRIDVRQSSSNLLDSGANKRKRDKVEAIKKAKEYYESNLSQYRRLLQMSKDIAEEYRLSVNLNAQV